MRLIHSYIYKEVILLTGAIIAVLTFLLLGVNLSRVIELIMDTDLPIWETAKFLFLAVPLTLTITIPAGLLAAVLIVLGRMSSDREILALKASGIGLAPIVAPVVVMALALSAIDYWLVAYVVPESQKEYVNMKHDIMTKDPLSLFTPETVVDKIPGWRLYFDTKEGNQLNNVFLWRLDDRNHLASSIRAEEARIDLDMDHGQLDMKLINGRQEEYPTDGDAIKVHPGGRGEQMVEVISLNDFYEKVEHRIPFMTMPEIESIIYAMQTAPTGEQPSPYLTELQARISFSIASFTFIVIGIPLAIQTQRRETSWGVVIALLIVGLYYFLGAFGRGFKNLANFYPELIVWTPNILFQFVGFWLFYRANRK
ncbi:MAG: LptF/LptG family permease [Methylacidiphilales bacterium]|nr:LptF/LptG family permease [Candidatus Methylacidiphilales bacterium]